MGSFWKVAQNSQIAKSTKQNIVRQMVQKVAQMVQIAKSGSTEDQPQYSWTFAKIDLLKGTNEPSGKAENIFISNTKIVHIT